jgi:predicted phage terminase large subunit-like protein
MKKNLNDIDIASIPKSQIEAEICRRDFYQFILKFWSVVESAPLVDGWMMRCVAKHLQHLVDFENLIINLPPGHGKSILLQILYPAWVWVNDPSMRIMSITNSQSLSTDFAIRCKRLLESEEFKTLYPEIKVTKDQTARDKFGLVGGGSRQATSVAANILGHRAELILADDLNAANHNTKEERDRVWQFFRGVLYSRMNRSKGKFAICVVQQRVHREDLTGRILEADIKRDWTQLALPFEHDQKRKAHTSLDGFNDKFGYFFTDPRHRTNELLSKLMTREQVAKLKRQMTVYDFEAQYQQNPKAMAGDIFKVEDFRYWTEDQDNYYLKDGEIQRKYSKASCWYFITCDLAVGEKDSKDYTVISTFAVTPGCELLMVDMGRSKSRCSDIVPFIRGYYTKYNASYIVIEAIAFQMTVVQDCRQAGLPVRPYHPHQDKVGRSYALQVRVENHEFYLPAHKDWRTTVEEELCDFGPNASKDDICDTAIMAGIQVLRQRPNYKDEEQLTPEQREQKQNEEMRKTIFERMHAGII